MADIIRERTGLDPEVTGCRTIEQGVHARMKLLGIARLDEYHLLVRSSREEWCQLMEAVLITETYFYRDGELFEAFVRLVREEWLSAKSSRLRILSVPCASGEEAYSIAMAMLDAGLFGEQFQVDAVDISPRCVAHARRAVYGRNSFRGHDLSFRDRFFTETWDGYALQTRVRNCVRFFEGNLLAPDFVTEEQQYDFVFCRNLLMYLDSRSRSQALDKISRMLSASGTLIVGAAELSIVLENGFVPAPIPNAFACRPRRGGAAVNPAARDAGRSPGFALVDAGSSRSAIHPGSANLPVWGDGEQETAMLDLARRLANTGDIEKARLACEAHLKDNGNSAQGWYLLGVLRDAARESSAVECYRRALYLDPRHYESLIQMALLSERAGDVSAASRFRSRASRVEPQSIEL